MTIRTVFFLLVSTIFFTNLTNAQNSTYCKGPVIIMEAEGIVESIPDIATFHINLSYQEKDKIETLSKLTDNIRSVLKVLAELEISDENIQTEAIELVDIYEEVDDDDVLIGYRGNAHLNFKIVNFDDLSNIVFEVMNASGNLVNSIYFSTTKEKELENAARKFAYENVVNKAKLYAELSGNQLGQACTITESDIDTISQEFEIYGASNYNNRWRTRSGEDTITVVASRIKAIPIKPGKIETIANVTIVYQLEN